MKITGSSGDLLVKFQVLCIFFHENILLAWFDPIHWHLIAI